MRNSEGLNVSAKFHFGGIAYSDNPDMLRLPTGIGHGVIQLVGGPIPRFFIASPPPFFDSLLAGLFRGWTLRLVYEDHCLESGCTRTIADTTDLTAHSGYCYDRDRINLRRWLFCFPMEQGEGH